MFSHRMLKQQMLKPAPPLNLSKEFKRVWLGWCTISDREVAREAAAKGIYISLALQFLATRKQWDRSDVDRWFQTEILTWVYQLLEQKQIFKATHILTNISVDYVEQFVCFFTETQNRSLRDYIGEYLWSAKKLETTLLSVWKLIQAFENANNDFRFKHSELYLENISNISIVNIDQKSREWKANVATVLFFYNYDFYLESFLCPKLAWKYLLENEKLLILKIWINVYFSKDLTYNPNKNVLDETISKKLKNMFLFWEISDQMINELAVGNYGTSPYINHVLLNELATFGVFVEKERNSLPTILTRFSQTRNIQNIYRILSEPTSTLTINDFDELLNQFCIENELYEVLCVCSNMTAKNYHKSNVSTSTKQRKRLISLLMLKGKSIPEEDDDDDDDDNDENINSINTFYKYLTSALFYFVDDNNIESFFKKNPMILIATILFHKNTNFYDILMNDQPLMINNQTVLKSTQVIQCLQNLPIIKNIFVKFPVSTDNLFEDLLKQYMPLVDFSDRNRIEYKCKNKISEHMSYVYYIREGRPSKAVKLYHLQPPEDLEEDLKGLITKYNSNDQVLTSCAAFLCMIAETPVTNNLKIMISAIDLIVTNHKYDYDSTKIENLFANISEQSVNILEILEEILLERFDEKNLMGIREDFQIVLNFAIANNLERPTKLLIHLIRNNNWLAFLIFTQIFNYPQTQVAELIGYFEKKSMREHFYHALLDQSEDLVYTKEMDLLEVIIKCYNSVDPPNAFLQAAQTYRTPLFAVLATCLEPDSVILCWLIWLKVSSDLDANITEDFPFSPDNVSDLMGNVLEKQFIETLLESFQIFLPDNPLHHLLEFLNECISFKHFDDNMKHLKQFEEFVSQLNITTAPTLDDYEYTYLSNSYWLIETSLKLIFITLGHCLPSKFYQIKFLQTLTTIEWNKNVPIEYPDFNQIVSLLETFTTKIVQLNLTEFLTQTKRIAELKRCIEICIEKKEFENAYKLASYGNIYKEHVLHSQWSYVFANQISSNFWTESDEAFEKTNLAPESTAGFYVECCRKLDECSDKYKALKLAYKWLKRSDQNSDQIERDIWSEYFALDDVTLRNSTFEPYETNHLLSEIQERTHFKSSKTRYEKDVNNSDILDPEQSRHLNETINKILISGDIIEALRLETIFNYKCTEISILLTCYELAEEKLKPYELSAEQRLVLLKQKPSNESDESFGDENKDILTLLEMFSERLKSGSVIANRIVMCYRISMHVHESYEVIVKHADPLTLLRISLTNKNNPNKLTTVHDIFNVFNLSRTVTLEFIRDELFSAIDHSAIDLSDHVTMWDLNLNQDFHLILRLCSDSNSLLGHELLTSSETYFARDENDERDCYVITELLIRSHDCFQTYCNMEGIANVLRKARYLSAILVKLKHWKRIVRLLTGIGRYSEMNYIFHVLKENDQFEFLLRREFRNDNSLKTAVFKYLKRYCPKDQDLYRMVALHFNLFSEVATLWETEALEMIRNLIEITKLEVQNQGQDMDETKIRFTNNASTELCLTKAMVNYSHAAEYHLHGGKSLAALRTAQQAELIAVQRALLQFVPNDAVANSTCILSFTTQQQLLQFLSTDTLLSFSQVQILIESYGNFVIDWGLLLFVQCIENNRIDYLRDYIEWKPLTYTIVQDVSRRFLASSHVNNTPVAINAMKELLKSFDSVQMRYRIASELGFTDVVEEMLANQTQLAYLKDTVWKKGYKYVQL